MTNPQLLCCLVFFLQLLEALLFLLSQVILILLFGPVKAVDDGVFTLTHEDTLHLIPISANRCVCGFVAGEGRDKPFADHGS